MFIRVEIYDEHDEKVLSRIIKEIEKVDGVLEVYPVVEAAQQSFAVDGAICSECGGSNGGHYVTCSQVF